MQSGGVLEGTVQTAVPLTQTLAAARRPTPFQRAVFVFDYRCAHPAGSLLLAGRRCRTCTAHPALTHHNHHLVPLTATPMACYPWKSMHTHHSALAALSTPQNRQLLAAFLPFSCTYWRSRALM
jgi:hypothetical protein